METFGRASYFKFDTSSKQKKVTFFFKYFYLNYYYFDIQTVDEA